MSGISNFGLMEPMHPDARPELENAAFDLVAESNRFAQRLHPVLRSTIGDLIRALNCYYSNLIEGHNTELMAIEKAMSNDFAKDPEQRNLQLEARAHIEVQAMIDHGKMPYPAASKQGICWIHQEFCSRLPQDLLVVTGDGLTQTVVPGQLRKSHVRVGEHIPPAPEHIDAFLTRFEQAYAGPMIGKAQRIVGVGSAHHRLAWIHPFLDGNGRVARLVSHAMYRELGIGSELWSVSRGLARRVNDYKALLAIADRDRQGDRDGRGNLTETGLFRFSSFFLDTALDQVRFMQSLLQIEALLSRIEVWANEEIAARRLPKGSFQLLREAILMGEFARGRAMDLTGYQERQARNVVSSLVERGLLVADGHRDPLRLGIPAAVVERWFPTLYQPLHQSAPALSQDMDEDDDNWPPKPDFPA